MTEVLLLGASGFIGRSISESLKQRNIPVLEPTSAELDLTKMNSQEILKSILEIPRTIIMAAAITKKWGDTHETYLKNLLMAANLDGALKNSQQTKLVFLSSTDIYGYPKLPINESSAIAPITHYALSKKSSESLLKMATESSNTPLLILRYNGIYGPGQTGKYGPNSFVESAPTGQVTIFGDGLELRDMVYVKDLAEIICQLAESSATGVYNIATGRPISFLDVALILQGISPHKFEIVHQPRTGPNFDQVFDTRKLRTILPNFEFTPIRKALRLTFQG